MPYFIAVRNGDDQHLDKVIDGNEHVLRARFADADYFYAQDTQKRLEDFLPRLDTLTFQEKLGSMLDKNQRVADLVPTIGEMLGMPTADIDVARKAAALAKADLATQMVVEMTSLQGTMGREYALMQGHDRAVADAIYEHWLPRGAEDSLPAGAPGTLLALVDRLDSLVGLFAAGLAPQATADPFGLRRAALGVIQILVSKQIDVDLAPVIEQVAAAQPIAVTPEARTQVLDFIAGRLRAWVEEQDWAHDVGAAVLAAQSANPYRAVEGIGQLAEWVAKPGWEAILDGFARCVRITRGESERHDVDPTLFQQDEERALYDAYQTAAAAVNGAERGSVDAFLRAFEPMLPAITGFFDNVLVNAEDPAVRRSRLGLLQAISALQAGRADLSHLSGF
jgi:glycyl-tRNA synthetase